ncbi:MAG TPA: hypothetical protein VEF35_01560 [Candidatus Bathyarchaeia archaeon]|nr:hypothetical protein [Candidatus Bathyarchaeia archaeon]
MRLNKFNALVAVREMASTSEEYLRCEGLSGVRAANRIVELAFPSQSFPKGGTQKANN